MPGVLNMMPLHHSEGLKHQNPLHENVRGTGILFSDIYIYNIYIFSDIYIYTSACLDDFRRMKIDFVAI